MASARPARKNTETGGSAEGAPGAARPSLSRNGRARAEDPGIPPGKKDRGGFISRSRHRAVRRWTLGCVLLLSLIQVPIR